MTLTESEGLEASPNSGPKANGAKWRQRMWEAVLDPRSIQWVLMIGGGLLVLGLIIWLGSFPFFQQPGILAVVMGIATAAVLGAGWFIVLRTRFTVAGQALTFLACIVAPLNLWFYDAQELITVERYLWMAALVCCLAYGATAYVLRDRLFVYVAEGGIVLSGMLLMANQGVVRQVFVLSLFLVVLGAVSIHVERAFSPTEGSFSRRRFGLAAFWSGHAQMGIGLVMLLAAQVLFWLRLPAENFLGYEWAEIGEEDMQLRTGLLWLVGTYVYLYSDLVVRRVGVYVYLAAFSLLLAIVTLVGWRFETEGIILALALAVLGTNLAQNFMSGDSDKLSRVVAPLGLILGALPLGLGLILHIRATSQLIAEEWIMQTGWFFVGAMVVMAIASRVGAFVQRAVAPRLSASYFFLCAAALLLAAAGLLRVAFDLTGWSRQAPLLMIIPIVYMVASRLWRGHSPERPLAWVAHTATAVMMLGVLGATVEWAGAVRDRLIPITGQQANLIFALVFAEAMLFYGLAAAVRKRGANIYLATAAACAALWQFLNYWEVQTAYSTLIFAVLGTAILLVNRVTKLERFQASALAAPSFQSGNALLTMAFLAASLQGLARLVQGREQVAGTLIPLTITAAVSALAAWIVQHSAWRRWYFTTFFVLTGLIFLTINVLIDLSNWQKLEIFCVVAGLVALVSGYVGMFREQEERSDLVDFGLWIGSILAAIPLLVAVIYHRFAGDGVSLINEFGLLTISVLILAAGLMFQVKSSTLLGGTTLIIHLLVLVISVGYIEQIAVGVYLAIGGAVLFALGIALSIYRERLLQLPGRIADREGVFRIIAWR